MVSLNVKRPVYNSAPRYTRMRILGSNVKQSKKRMFVLGCVLVCCMLSAGCHYERSGWAYRASNYPAATPVPINQAVVVLPFKDSRPTENKSKFFGWPMCLIPLIPYGWADYARPESPETVKFKDIGGGYSLNLHPHASPWQFSPVKDFTEAAVEELIASGLFKAVLNREQATDGDLILRGELKPTRYNAKIYTYGLGPLLYAPYLLGAPIASTSNELDVEFVLKERETGRQLWHKSYHETKGAKFFYYWSPPEFEFYYDRLFSIIMQDVVKSLQAELPARTSGTSDGSPVFSRSSSPN